MEYNSKWHTNRQKFLDIFFYKICSKFFWDMLSEIVSVLAWLLLLLSLVHIQTESLLIRKAQGDMVFFLFLLLLGFFLPSCPYCPICQGYPNRGKQKWKRPPQRPQLPQLLQHCTTMKMKTTITTAIATASPHENKNNHQTASELFLFSF